MSRIDPPTNRVVDTITVGSRPGGIVDAAGSIWVANTGDSTITRIDPASDEAAKPLPIAATELAYGAGSVIPTGNGPTALAVDRRGVWVSNQFDGKLALIDPRTDGARRIDVGNQPQGLAVAGGNILVGVDTQSAAAHRGGTLRMRANLGPDSIDPAVAYSGTSYWLMSLTTDGLVHGGGPFGAQVPDLAVSIPTPTDGGKTYTFHLRRGIRYSNGKPLRAADFRYGIERFFKIGPFPYFGGIVGATRCAASPKRCDLSRGIVTNDSSRTVTFHLVAPDPGFLDKLAVNFAVPMPVGTPARRGTTRPLPTTGPYTIESYRPKHSLTLKRNPFFHEWSRAAQPDGYVDRIVFDVGGTADDAVADVVGGRADLFSSVLSSDRLSRARLARLAIHDASQLHTFPMTDTAFLFLNTRVPPFDRLDARRAVNYAVDRAAVVEILGGPKVAEPTCQIIPPNFPGYRPYCPYTAGDPAAGKWTAPDLVKARALIARSGTRGMKVTVWATLSGDVANGVAVGEAAANDLIAFRAGDGRGAATPAYGTIGPILPGQWQLQSPTQTAQTPWVATMQPFLLERPSQFRVEPPPALGSRQYAKDLNETKAYGALNSAVRTPGQTAIAYFWNANAINQYNQTMQNVVGQRGLDLVDAAHLFAMGDLVVSDAGMACMDSKYFYLFWRPITAIQNADKDGNSATTADPTWAPLLGTPNHPEYPAAHGCVTAAFSDALAAALHTKRLDVTVPGATNGGTTLTTTQHFNSVRDLQNQIVDARVWIGFHYRNSVEQGLELGNDVAGWVLDRYFKAAPQQQLLPDDGRVSPTPASCSSAMTRVARSCGA